MSGYEELSEIFSDKDNYSQSRELLKEVSKIQNNNGNDMCSIFTILLKTGNEAMNDDVASFVRRADAVRNMILTTHSFSDSLVLFHFYAELLCFWFCYKSTFEYFEGGDAFSSAGVMPI